MTRHEIFKARRLQLGLTQSDVSAKADISRSAVMMIENNRRVPKRRTISDLCKALELNPDTLEPLEPFESAWDELPDMDISRNYGNYKEILELFEWFKKYEEALKGLSVV